MTARFTKGLRLLLRLLPWALVLLPAAAAAWLLERHVVNVPFLDDWMFTEMYEKARGQHGGLSLHDFFAVQMEHRLAWPRLVIILLDKICPGRFDAQCWVTFGLLCLTFLNVGWLLRRSAGAFSAWWPVLALAGMAIFSPVQYQILLWPMMFQVATPAAALTSGLVIMDLRRLPLWLRFALCALCASAASLSIASGLLVWVLLIPVVLWGAGLESWKVRLRFGGLWVTAFAVFAALYFHNLKNETEGQFAYRAAQEEVTATKGISALLRDPVQAVLFTVRFVAGPICRGTSGPMMDLALAVGGVFLLAFAGFLCVWLWKFKDAEMRASWLPWLCFGLYSPATGFLVALGRAWVTKDGDNALQARYVIHGIPLLVAVLALCWLAGCRWKKSCPDKVLIISRGCSAGATLLFSVLLVGWLHGVFMMQVWESSRLRGLVNTLFFELGTKYETWVDPESQMVSMHEFALRTNRMGLLTPRMFRTNRLDQFRMGHEYLRGSNAELVNLRLVTDDSDPKFRAIAEGHASLPSRHRVADGIFFACRDSRGLDSWKIFCVAQVQGMPLPLEDSLGRDMRFVFGANKEVLQNLAGFQVVFPLDFLPKEPSEQEISAWAYDFKKNTVYPMMGRYRVNLAQPKIIKLRNPNKPAPPPQ
ncbi:MAG: hypothetical protein KA004_10025 [Verrucomicrobiales bacterium]|nr:hypothetical protein [Verrucomicrobiales bacterium]